MSSYESTAAISTACPKCGHTGSMSYFSSADTEYHKDFIDCSNCGRKYQPEDEIWERLMQHKLDRPD